MHRALTIAKFIPAAICVLLFATWIASHWFIMGFATSKTGGDTFIGANAGRLVYEHSKYGDRSTKLLFRRRNTPSKIRPRNFRFSYTQHWLEIYVAISAVITVLLPLAIGLFCRFRFPLWSWFAFTALVAAECAYYFRA